MKGYKGRGAKKGPVSVDVQKMADDTTRVAQEGDGDQHPGIGTHMLNNHIRFTKIGLKGIKPPLKDHYPTSVSASEWIQNSPCLPDY